MLLGRVFALPEVNPGLCVAKESRGEPLLRFGEGNSAELGDAIVLVDQIGSRGRVNCLRGVVKACAEFAADVVIAPDGDSAGGMEQLGDTGYARGGIEPVVGAG